VELRNTKVEHLNEAISSDDDVLRLYVAVNESGGVGGRERGRNLRAYADGIASCNVSCCYALSKRDPVNKFSRDEVDRIGAPDLMYREDIWMIECRDYTCFSSEALGGTGMTVELSGKYLERRSHIDLASHRSLDLQLRRLGHRRQTKDKRVVK
jgi:hypothetical protein